MILFALVVFTNFVNAQLAAECLAGDYEESATHSGVKVSMDYSTSNIYKDGNGDTFLSVSFLVPTQFEEAQTLVDPETSSAYERSFAITFHDRSADTPVTAACYTNRAAYSHCPSVTQTWVSTPGVADLNGDACLSQVTGELPFDEVMRSGYVDADAITMVAETVDVEGYSQPVWDVYMVAFVETWAGLTAQRDGETGDDLVITDERYSSYYVPFRLRFPQRIQLEQAEQNDYYAGGDLDEYPSITQNAVTLSTSYVVLYAVIEQTTFDIDFNPENGEAFGAAKIVLATQTSFPFGLMHYTTPADQGGAVIRSVSGDIASVEFTSATQSSECNGVVSVYEQCSQEWEISVVPNLCDISGNYEAEFYAECFDTSEGCGIDDNQGNPASNSFSGVLKFSLRAQEFCPSILDEIDTTASISKYVDADYSVAAVPGTNLFVNDHVWYEVEYLSTSAKDNGPSWGPGDVMDDTLIEFVRARKILMSISMVAEPLQYSIDMAGGDVTKTSDLIYEIDICDVPAATFPYPDNVMDSTMDCFQNLNYIATTYLAFEKQERWTSNGALDKNEIGFKFRLDERVIPADIPNSESVVTVDIWTEVYYNGVTNPSRRKLRREMQVGTRQSGLETRDVFSLGTRNEMTFCTIGGEPENVGFSIDVLMRTEHLPNVDFPHPHLQDAEHHIARYLKVPTAQVSIYRADICVDSDNCQELYPQPVEDKSLQFKIVRYYVDMPGSVATEFQQDLYYKKPELYEDSPFLNGKIVKTYAVDQCSEQLDSLFSEERNRLDVDTIVVVNSSAAGVSISLLAMVLLFFY